MCNIKMSAWLEIIGSFLGNQLLQINFETRGRITTFLYYNYRVDSELDKVACVIQHISCAGTGFISQLDKYWLPTISPSYQPSYADVENYYSTKILEHYNNWIIMNVLDNKAPQVEFDNIPDLILAVT